MCLPSWINELSKINQMLFDVWTCKIMDCAWADLEADLGADLGLNLSIK